MTSKKTREKYHSRALQAIFYGLIATAVGWAVNDSGEFINSKILEGTGTLVFWLGAAAAIGGAISTVHINADKAPF